MTIVKWITKRLANKAASAFGLPLGSKDGDCVQLDQGWMAVRNSPGAERNVASRQFVAETRQVEQAIRSGEPLPPGWRQVEVKRH